jgi:hypothetical protein
MFLHRGDFLIVGKYFETTLSTRRYLFLVDLQGWQKLDTLKGELNGPDILEKHLAE